MKVAGVLAVIAAAAVATAAVVTHASGPPPSVGSALTANGRVLWNLDALLNDTFGKRTACFDARRVEIFAVTSHDGCPAPEARYQQYGFTFRSAAHSQFRLVRLRNAPNVGATNAALRIGSDYVSCPNGYLRHGGRGWLSEGGSRGPTALFWCV